MSKNRALISVSAPVRCAIYCRKSTEAGLEQNFNSLDAQWDACEAYIHSQQASGWQCLPQHYDDGGFTGGNMERPALQRLLADMADGKIDVVVVQRVDRLSRSLLDFSKMMERFEQHQVAFVSISQQFNSATSMGRLVLNVLLSFSQFERELISERTSDKIRLTRRRGKWTGGRPLLGYDVDAQCRLVVNEPEAQRVRSIFELYLQQQSLISTIAELDQRGWNTKRWTARKGHELGGTPFTKATLHQLLTNVAYVGQVKYKDEVHPGEQQAIVPLELWQQVQQALSHNRHAGGAAARNQFGALLKGLLRCAACDCAMSPSHSTKQGQKRYRYYVCNQAQKRGWQNCPSKTVPAQQMEAFVVSQLQAIGRDPQLLRETIAQARLQQQSQLADLKTQQQDVQAVLKRGQDELRRLLPQLAAADPHSPATARLADLQEQLQRAEQRAHELQKQITTLSASSLDDRAIAKALARFDPVWQSLTPREQTRLIHLLVERVAYHGGTGQVSITFHPAGLQVFSDELAQAQESRRCPNP